MEKVNVAERAAGARGDVSLRAVARSDLQIFFAHQQDPEAAAMASFETRDREAFTSHWTKILSDDSVVKKTILFGDRVVGNIVSWVHDGRREVGYWIGRDYWGKGIATTALSRFLREVRIRPIYAHVAKHNVGSIRVLEKCGFTNSDEEIVTSRFLTRILVDIRPPIDKEIPRAFSL